MAHGDALIFLTNIVWIFVLFLFIYLFFVVLFLPAFYKKFRIRVLVRGLIKVVSALSLRNVFVSLTFFSDFFRNLRVQFLGFLGATLFYFIVRLSRKGEFFKFLAPKLNAFAGASNKSLFIDSHVGGEPIFFKKSK